MSEDTIKFLQTRLTALEGENASLKAENKDRRIKGKKLDVELEQLRGQVGTLTTERDTLDTKLKAAPNELQAKVDALEGQIRTRDHKDAFGGVREFASPDGKKYALREGVTVDALWKQLDYKAEGETPKAEAVTARLGEALQSHPFLFAAVEATAPGGAQRPGFQVTGREAGPGAGKGSDSPTVTAAMGGKAVTTAGAIPGRI